MFGRIFGRGKDDPERVVCAQCGRTLLAGEWTRKVAGADGAEQLICSLCGPDHPLNEDEPAVVTWTPANNGRVRETREESRPLHGEADISGELDTKDGRIEVLREQLARVEAQNQELAREVARLRAAITGIPVPAETGADVAAEPLAAGEADVIATAPAEERAADSSEPGERTWGETPAEFAAELAAAMPAPQETAEEAPSAEEQASAHVTFEDTAPAPALVEADQEVAGGGPLGAETRVDDEKTDETLAAEKTADEPVPASAEAEVAALALLQRGVDLFNVSRVPRKIAETNEQLGTPRVYAGPDDPIVAITFMWSMGWYRFHVDTISGNVSMADRGYEETADISSNADVRADGTIHLAPAQISRAAAQRVRQDEATGPRASERRPSEPESPHVAAQKPPEILSKSLLGQRSDDEPAAWEKTKARDFDWDR